MSTRDEQIGRNVQKLRGNTSQQAVADLMRERGFDKWSQATVWAVEKGTRPLRVSEGEALTEALGSRYYKLTGSDHETDLLLSHHAASQAFNDIKHAAKQYMEARVNIDLLLHTIAEDGEEVAGPYASGGGWLDKMPVDAAREGVEEWGDDDYEVIAGWKVETVSGDTDG